MSKQYIGPESTKTWQRLTMKNQEIELDKPKTDADKQKKDR